MGKRAKGKVAVFVYNNCKNDARVLKESKSLVDDGYDVTIYALLDKETTPEEIRDGIKIVRILRNPIHLVILRGINKFFWFFYPKTILRFFVRFFVKIGILKARTGTEANSGDVLVTSTITQIKLTVNSWIQWIIAHKILLYTIGWIALVLIYMALLTIKLCFKVFYSLKSGLEAALLLFHRPLSFWDYYKRAYKILKQEKVDFYHCNDLNTLPIGYWLKRKNGGKLIYDSHELYIERNRYRMQSYIYKKFQLKLEDFLCNKCEGVMTVCDSIAEYMGDLYGIKTPTVVMNAPSLKRVNEEERVNNEVVKVREILDIDPNSKLLLYAGAITFNRGLENLIRCLEFLDGYHLMFLGYGKEEYLTKLNTIAKDSKVDSRFSTYGPVPHYMVPLITKQADLGIAPIQNICLSYYFCAPNKVFEYLLGGIPVIGSNFPELEKLIKGYNVGYTFDPEEPTEIAAAVEQVFQNQEEYMAMKERTKNAAQNYNWENEAEKLLGLYRSV